MSPNTLIHRYLLGEATKEEVQQLDQLLAGDPQLRRRMILEAQADADLREIALERMSETVPGDRQSVTPAVRTALSPLAWLATAASFMLLATLAWSQLSRPAVIATLVSVEDASWESSLPTEPGSELTGGYLKLTSGIATIQFQSGAEITLEAPANLVLETSMRARLVSGAALVEVPDSAIGFVLETPGGYAVDYGTKFAVHVDGSQARSEFEVLSGEIAVHLESGNEDVRLTDGGTASISAEKLTTFDGPMPEKAVQQLPRVVRIGTEGRATSVIRNNKRKKWLHPDLLMLRQSRTGNNFDRRSFFSFDLSELDLDSVQTAELKLNLVPSGIGFANRLPKINRFAVYGMTNAAKDNWDIDCLWEEGPGPEDGEILGKFEIRRSRQTGVYGVKGGKLLDFLKEHAARPITLIVVRETSHIDGTGASLVHAIANDSHPEAPGPVLEFSLD